MKSRSLRNVLIVGFALQVLSGIAGVTLGGASAQAGAAVIIWGLIGLVLLVADARRSVTHD
jgi:hypothetical protein